MKNFSVFRIVIFICLLLYTSTSHIVIATAPGTFVEWTTKCLKNLKEYPTALAPDETSKEYPAEDKASLKSSFDLIGNPKLEPLIDQYNTNHPKKSSLEKPGFVQKFVLMEDSELCIIGDIHGCFHPLLRILWRLILKGYLDIHLKIIKPHFYVIFTGDYTDRGHWGAETLITLLMLANQNFDAHTNTTKVFLLRGNHEERRTNEDYGFSSELNAKYGEGNGPAVFNLVDEWYSHLPLALFIGRNGIFAQCCHGGIESAFDVKDFLRSPGPIRDLGINQWQGFSWCDFKYTGPTKILTSTSVGRIDSPGSEVDFRTGLAQEVAKYVISGPKYIFRGHQDKYYGLKMCIASSENYPEHWKKIITDIPASGTKTIKLNTKDTDGKPKYEPIYTFSTAATVVCGLYDCYGIVTVGATLDNWTLTPYEFSLATIYPGWAAWNKPFYSGPLPSEDEKESYQRKLDEYFNGSFALIKENPTGGFDPLDVTLSGWQKTPPDNPIYPEILAKVGVPVAATHATMGHTTAIAIAPKAAITTKLHGLKQSLENLKIKLDQLKTKLARLKRPPSHSFFTISETRVRIAPRPESHSFFKTPE